MCLHNKISNQRFQIRVFWLEVQALGLQVANTEHMMPLPSGQGNTLAVSTCLSAMLPDHALLLELKCETFTPEYVHANQLF